MIEFLGLMWLVGYIVMNLATTVLNKAILLTFNVPFPQTLVLWHYTCTAVGSAIIIHGFKMIKPAKLDGETHKKLFMFSVLFNVNILVSAVSLNMVSMALHQIIRALTPGFTVAICMVVQGKTYSRESIMAVMVIFLGVSLYALKGEVSYSMLGIIVTLAGAFLASLKGVITNMFMVGDLKLHPFDLLQYMSGYAMIQMLAYLTLDGTLAATYSHLRETATPLTFVMILLNGAGAFFLNIVSFQANKSTSPLAMNVAGITKQVMAIILGIVIFATPVTSLSAFGVCVTSLGIIWYARASFREKLQKSDAKDPRQQLPTTAPSAASPSGKIDAAGAQATAAEK